MNIQVKNEPKSELLLTIEVSPEELQKYEEQATKRISEQVDIPGFRKGQAPKAFVMSQVGPEAFFQETLSLALPQTYFNAVKEKNLQVISRPMIKVTSRTPLVYEARVATVPEITIKDFEKIKIPQEPIVVNDKEIDEVIEEMRKYRATYKPIDRAISKGDRIEIDFQGYDEGGAPLEKTKSVNHPLFLGEGSLVAGFEDELLGMKVGEKKKFPVKFPKDYNYEPFRGKTVQFEAQLKQAQETVLPEVNEDFVAQLMGAPKPVTEFREVLKKDIHARKTVESRRERENQLLEKLIKEAKFDVPPILIEEEVDYMIEDLKREVEGRKLSFETYLEKLKNEKRDIRKEYEAEAKKRIQIRLILNYLFREMKIEVSDEEMQQAATRLIQSSPDEDRAALEKSLKERGEIYLRLKNNVMLEKLFVNFLGENL